MRLRKIIVELSGRVWAGPVESVKFRMLDWLVVILPEGFLLGRKLQV